MDGHFGFYLKAIRHNRKTFDKAARKSAIACHYIFYVRVKDAVDDFTNENIAKIMAKTFVFAEISRAEAVTNSHIGAVLNSLNKLGGVASKISIVGVYHEVNIGRDITEHRTNNIPFSLKRFTANNDAGVGFFGKFGTIVGGVVVVDINLGVRQDTMKIRNNRSNSFSFVIAWDENSDL